MNLSKNKSLLAALALCWIVTGCSSSDDDASEGVMVTDGGDTSGEMVTDGGDTPVATFNFSTDAPDAFTRVDRMGMPAIATALIASKDDYNQSNPVDDAASVYVPEILNSLTFLHGALDEQLRGLGLTPCTVNGDGTGTCAAAAVPLILPDTLKIDTSAAAGFPNGRMLTDPVIDVTLAVALLELTGDPAPHAATALVGVLNPSANDKAFEAAFPFLAAPHE